MPCKKILGMPPCTKPNNIDSATATIKITRNFHRSAVSKTKRAKGARNINSSKYAVQISMIGKDGVSIGMPDSFWAEIVISKILSIRITKQFKAKSKNKQAIISYH